MKAYLTTLVEQLERIAKLNKDRFEYRIQVLPHPCKNGVTLENTFVCEESAEQHVFLALDMCDVETLTEEGLKEVLTGACKSWGYRYLGTPPASLNSENRK